MERVQAEGTPFLLLFSSHLHLLPLLVVVVVLFFPLLYTKYLECKLFVFANFASHTSNNSNNNHSVRLESIVLFRTLSRFQSLSFTLVQNQRCISCDNNSYAVCMNACLFAWRMHLCTAQDNRKSCRAEKIAGFSAQE